MKFKKDVLPFLTLIVGLAALSPVVFEMLSEIALPGIPGFTLLMLIGGIVVAFSIFGIMKKLAGR